MTVRDRREDLPAALAFPRRMKAFLKAVVAVPAVPLPRHEVLAANLARLQIRDAAFPLPVAAVLAVPPVRCVRREWPPSDGADALLVKPLDLHASCLPCEIEIPQMLQIVHHVDERARACRELLPDLGARFPQREEPLLAETELAMQRPEEIEQHAVDRAQFHGMVVVRIHIRQRRVIVRVLFQHVHELLLRHVIIPHAVGEIPHAQKEPRQSLAAEAVLLMERRVDHDLRVVPDLLLHVPDIALQLLRRESNLLLGLALPLLRLRLADAGESVCPLSELPRQSHHITPGNTAP